MVIVNQQNRKTLEDLNNLLENAQRTEFFILTELKSMSEIGVILSIPPFFDSSRKPSKMAFIENYRESELSIDEIIETINEELEQLLKVIKKEVLKLIRINEAFTIEEQAKINDNVTDTVQHINIQFD